MNPDKLVHTGIEDWLFLTGGSNFVTTLYDRQEGHLPDSLLIKWRHLLERRERRCDNLGIHYVHITVPDKLTVYGHKQASPLVDPDLAPAIRLGDMMRISPSARCWVDLVQPMRAARDTVDLYWKTDTHWTPEGCILAYVTLCQQLGLEPNPDLNSAPSREFAARMDLGGKVNPVQWEAIRESDFSGTARRTFINSVTAILENPAFGSEIHVGSRVAFVNSDARNTQKVLIFGDSYASQRMNMLTGLFAGTVRNVEFIWSANIDWSFVKAAKPDILITEVAERFMTIVPHDRVNLRVLEARQAVKALRRRFERWIATRLSRS